MGEENQNTAKGWLDNISEGGLPQLIAGPAGKALSRLIGAGVEIPAAWLEQKAQGIRDETEARSKVTQMLAEKSAELGLSDTKLLDRGLNNLLGRAYREQENREAVAIGTIKELEKDPAPTSGAGPSDDWMNTFESHAAKASSEELRNLFSRVLAGEIRKPGRFSLSTMQLMSVLDSQLAALIERVSPFVWDESAIFKDTVDGQIDYRDLLHLEEVGVVSLSGGMMTVTKEANEFGFVGFQSHGMGVVASFEPNKRVQLTSYAISRAGKELMSTLSVQPQFSSLAKVMRAHGATKVQFGPAVPARDGGFILPIAREIP